MYFNQLPICYTQISCHAYMYNIFPCRVNVQLYKEEIGELRDKLNKEKKTR